MSTLLTWSYSLLLGFYLGDGCVYSTNRSYQLRVVVDGGYPEVIGDCVMAITLSLRHEVNVRVRPIVLTGWQREIVDAHPRPFLRGLLHSDGCRTINRFKTTLPSGRVAEYAYPRYFFSNRSADIRGLFCEYCDRLGIRWTQSNPRNISVAHRDSVARLDAFVGPKA